MTTKDLKDLDQTAQSLGRAYHYLQSAYVELAQLETDWPKGLSEYLYDETYNHLDFKTFIRVMVLDLAELQTPLQTLAIDTATVSSELQRFGVGDSFSV